MIDIKTFTIVSATSLLVACGGGADDAIYKEYHSLMCKAVKLQTTPSDIARQAELNKELEKFAADSDHALNLMKAMDTSDC